MNVEDLTGNDRSVSDMLRTIEGMREDAGYAGSKPRMDQKDYIDAKTEATRAQNDARFAEVLSELRSTQSAIAHIEQRTPSIWQIAGVAATTLGIGIAIIAFAGDRFDAGLSLSNVVQQVQSDQIQRDADQDQKLDKLSDQIGELATSIRIIEKAVVSQD